MINIDFNPKTFTLDITGHSEYGEKGEDIVCAAISILFYTLAQSLFESKQMIEEEIDYQYDDGNGHISCKPKAEYEANVSLIYWTILNGFELIATNYEKNVTLNVVG